jgi:hypothetical protein
MGAVPMGCVYVYISIHASECVRFVYEVEIDNLECRTAIADANHNLKGNKTACVSKEYYDKMMYCVLLMPGDRIPKKYFICAYEGGGENFCDSLVKFLEMGPQL